MTMHFYRPVANWQHITCAVGVMSEKNADYYLWYNKNYYQTKQLKLPVMSKDSIKQKWGLSLYLEGGQKDVRSQVFRVSQSAHFRAGNDVTCK